MTDLAADPPGRARATAIGFSAVLMWSTLALLTTLAGPVPPFLLVALVFAVPSAMALIAWRVRGVGIVRQFRLPVAVWSLGLFGLFAYHAFYVVALQNAPPVEASLIAYLAPVLIVLGSALLPGERLRWWHVAGAALGFAGAYLVVGKGGLIALNPAYSLGYGAALACAVIWATYSVLSRRLRAVPTDSVGAFCAATSALSLLCHLAVETTRWPQGWSWLALLGLGLGPMGGAFFVWDRGCKHGDIRVLGVLFYIAPLLSTLLLVLLGFAEASRSIAAGCALIVGGAALASREFFRR
ncbi:MAG: EamA family transporter [Alphaproteobacteria bacterium]|nr:EamA family transporter [Alphaproteobacteria bacterium]